jgi:hypothetical protein
VKMSMSVFSVVTPCGPVDRYQSSSKTLIFTYRIEALYFSKTVVAAYKMEAGYSSETLVSTCKSTRRYSPEDQHRLMTFSFESSFFFSKNSLKVQRSLVPMTVIVTMLAK